MRFTADHYCFACGHDNPIGLHLHFTTHDTTSIAEFTARREHQGYQGVMHGGLIATLLDEAMARHVWTLVGPAATARLEVAFRHPVPIEAPLTLRGWVTAARRPGRVYAAAADLRAADGTVLAEATGIIMRVAPPGIE